MNDEELHGLLAAGDRPLDPPPDVSARVRAAIAAELHHPTPSPDQIVDIPVDACAEGDDQSGDGGRRAPRWLVAAATVLVVAGVIGIALRPSSDWGSREPEPVSDAAVEERPAYLRACLDLRTASRPDGQQWRDVLAELDPESDEGRSYLDEVATALTALAGTSTAAPLATPLASASAIAREGNPDPTALADALDALADELSALTGARCL